MRGGSGNGLLGWCRKALSAYTWCRVNKGPQNEWLHRIGKADTDKCSCGEVMSGTHVVEECPELDQWRPVWKEWKEALGGRAVGKKEAEEEGDLLGPFFYPISEFLFSFSNPSPVIHSVPAKYAISFIRPSSLISRSISPVIPVIVPVTVVDVVPVNTQRALLLSYVR